MRHDMTNESLMAVRSALSVYRGLSNIEKALEFVANLESYVSELEQRKASLELEIEKAKSDIADLTATLGKVEEEFKEAKKSQNKLISELNASYREKTSKMEEDFVAKKSYLEADLAKFEEEANSRKIAILQEIDSLEDKRKEAEEKLESIRKLISGA